MKENEFNQKKAPSEGEPADFGPVQTPEQGAEEKFPFLEDDDADIPDEVGYPDKEDDWFDWMDDIVEEGRPLNRVLSENGILTMDQRVRYEHYDSSNPGCSRENPIVISETEDYVRLEYIILDFLLTGGCRYADYALKEQRLVGDGDRFFDHLIMEVTDFVGEDEEPVTGEEHYWFDITAGFNSLRERLAADTPE